MINPFPIVVADVRRTLGGVIAVVCLIAVAVALGVAVSAQERALRKGSTRAADSFDLLVGAPGSPTQLVLSTVYLQPAAIELVDGEILRKLTETEGVKYAAPLAFGDFYRGYPIIGTTTEFLTQGGKVELAEGRMFRSMWEVVAGANVKKLNIGDKFHPVHGLVVAEAGLETEHGGIEYTVVGRMPPLGSPWDQALVTTVEAIWVVHALPTGHEPAADGSPDPDNIGPPWLAGETPGVPAIVVKPASVRDAYVLRQKYRRGGTMALFPAEVLIEMYARLGDARDLLAMISVATQALVIGAILLAVFASLALRRRQLAVLRALGASRTYVFATIWVHVSVMIAVGATFGLGLGWFAALVLSWVFEERTGVALPVSITLQEVGLAGALILIGFVLAAIPGLMSYRQSVSTALQR
jgi:putative ABC transport system permease protein